MTACAIASIAALGFSSVSLLSAADVIDVPRTLHGIEERYNRTQTLQLSFTESYQQGARTRVEKGDLFLRKPGRMRWQYTAPPGKLFVSDGKFIYSYTPQDNRAEKMKLQETDDMRAPLAFLLGRLDFNRDFREYTTHQEGAKTWVKCIPKSDKLPYTEVSFLASAGGRIEHVRVVHQDRSIIDFDFSGEVLNPPIADQVFHFQIPPGAEYIDSTTGTKGDR